MTRQALADLPRKHGLAGTVWEPAQRWWQGNAPEWDAATQDVEGQQLLVAESKWSESAFTVGELKRLVGDLLRKPLPPVGAKFKQVERALCIPTIQGAVPEKVEGVWLISGRDVLAKASPTRGGASLS